MYRIKMSDGSIIRTEYVPSLVGNNFIEVISEATGNTVTVGTRQIVTIEYVG